MLDIYLNKIESHYRVILLLVILAIIVPVLNTGNLVFSSDMRVFFPEDNEYRKSLESLENTFGAQDNLLVYIENPNGTIFTQSTLKLISEVTEKLWQTPYSRRVDSITNYQRTKALQDEIHIDFLIEDTESLTRKKIIEIENYSLSDPSLKNRLISESGNATAINVQFSFPTGTSSSTTDIPTLASIEAKQYVQKTIESMRQSHPELKIQLGGIIAANLTMSEAVEKDLQTLLPLSYLLLFGMILYTTGSIAFVLTTITVVTLSILGAFGLFSFCGRPLSPPSALIPPAIMSIAVADCIHLFSGYSQCVHRGVDHRKAVLESLKANFKPVLITSITTVIGLLGLNFSESQPYRDMGNTMAFGVSIALILSLTALPCIMLMFSNIKVRAPLANTQRMEKLSRIVAKHFRALCLITAFAVAIACIGFVKNEVSERWYTHFGESFEIRKTIESINSNLTGIHSFQYVLETGEEHGVYDPNYWKDMESLVHWIESQDQVAQVDSMLHTLKSINKNMNGGDENYYRIPESRELIAQYMLVYEFSLPQGLGIETYLDTDRSSSRLAVSLYKSDSKYMTDLDDRISEWLQENAHTIEPTHGAGMDLMFSRIAQDNAISLLNGTLVILLLVSFIMLIVLKSVKLGLLSLIPNVIPAIMAYGLWGYFNGKIDLSSSVVICMSLGIVVDDTVHFLSKYQYSKDKLLMSTEEAIHYSYTHVGNALIITTLALVAGFAVTIFSGFQPSANMGVLLSLTISLALVIDLLLLPPLLLLFDRKK